MKLDNTTQVVYCLVPYPLSLQT